MRNYSHVDVDGVPSQWLFSTTPPTPSSMAMSGTVLTRSFRKSKRDSDIMHCLRCDGDNVFAFRLFVMLLDFESKLSTNNSKVREIMTGTACAIFPTSSSACIILLIRPCKINNTVYEFFFVFTFAFLCFQSMLGETLKNTVDHTYSWKSCVIFSLF
jgi:hypothetical protein